MTRREMIGALAALPLAAQGSRMRNIGGAPAGFPVRSRAGRGAPGGFDFVAHCHNLGLGVVETRLPSTEPDAVRKFRTRAEELQLRVILDVGYPRDEAG